MRIFSHLVVVVAAGALVATSARSRAQAPAADAAAGVLAAAREALGGEKKLTAVKSLIATGRTRQVRGENLVPIEFEISIELPDRFVRKDEIPAQESEPTTVGFNGDALIQLPVPAVAAPEAARTARLAGARQDFARLMLGMFAASFSSVPLTFTYAGKAEAPQGRADVLNVKGPGNFSARLFVNADTHLPIMVTWTPPPPPQRGGTPRGGAPSARGAAPPARGESPSRSDAPPAPAGPPPAPAGAPAPPPESRLFFAEYRDVGGLQLPFRLRRAVGPDTVEETTFDGFKINPKIDAKKFEVRK